MASTYDTYLFKIEKKFATDSNELHYVKGIINSIFRSIKFNRPTLDKYNTIIYEQLEASANQYINLFDNKLFDYLSDKKELKDLVNKFLSLMNKIAYLNKRITTYKALYSMTEADFNNAMRINGEELAKTLVFTGRVILPANLGTLAIYIATHVKPRIDWGESNKMKQCILDEGGIPKNIANPDGEKWLIYRTDKDYPFVKYLYNKAIFNLQYYTISISNYNNCNRDGIVETKPRSFDECFRSQYGLLQKILRCMEYELVNTYPRTYEQKN